MNLSCQLRKSLKLRWLGLQLFACTALVLSSPLQADITSSSADSGSFSPANTLLFASNHMQAVKPNQILVYDLQQSGSMVEAIKDTVTMKLAVKDANHKETAIEFMTGEHNRWIPPFTDPEGNPVLMLFLQTDIHDMERINGGQWRHFQKYIKFALEKSDVSETSFNYAGKTLTGKKVSIQPYLDDPDKGKFNNQAFVNKQYDFIVSTEVPGGIYKIVTDVPGPTADQPIAHKELLLRDPSAALN
ncbi:MAG: hypothetical protein E6Q85_07080 [Thiothrix sp.]|nr:MAG: hypothetical protein E6Q85_07080 [Thiothrix sp.]